MKFISSSYDEESGLARVTMQHLGQKFLGTAQVHPDEKDKGSEYAGCYYAEIRATIRALKYEKNIISYEYNVLKRTIKSCECYKKFNNEEGSAKVLYRQINRKKKRIDDITKEIDEYKKELQRAISNRANFLNAMKAKTEGRKAFEKAIEENNK